ncbi:CLUMA_CG002084, isoform A [Clunio marinus]|uniref:CLUMA_CG002084, isoform A n=1 Tax=Clunio marinus TaxID=568069 RepID=A0A1J1HQ16_9DIPT|nr:CLUMA_CG002084, isoform A [Clunio marinus]
MAFGDYPPEYNPKIHGVYDPARYYGKLFHICQHKFIFLNSADTPFGQLKLGEVLDWFKRRNKTPSAFIGACSRGYWRWQHKYCQPKRAGIVPFCHTMGCSMLFLYIVNYGNIKLHRNYKYH